MLKRFYLCLITLILPAIAFADSGFYVGGEVGYTSTNNPSEVDGFTKQAKSDAIDLNTSLYVDDSLSSMSKGLFAGYWIKDNLAIEVGYTRVVDAGITYQFGDAGHVSLSADIDRLSLSLLPFYKINDRLDIYGRIGYAESTATLNSSSYFRRADSITPENYVLGNDKGTGLLAGVGFRYHNDHYYMRVEGQYDDSLYGLKGVVMGFGYQY